MKNLWKVTILFILFLLKASIFSSLIYSQTDKIDSLKKIIKRLPYDTVKVNNVNKLGLLFLDDDPAKGLQYIDEAFILAESLNYQMGIADSYCNKAKIFAEMENNQQAIDQYEKAMQIYKDEKQYIKLIQSYREVGRIYEKENDYQKAMKYYNKGLSMSRKTANNKEVAGYLNEIGIIYYYMGNNLKAIESFKNSIKLYRQIDCESEVAGALNNIGDVYRSIGDYTNALSSLQQALKISKKYKNYKDQATNLMNIGNIHLVRGNLDLSLKYYNEALKINEEINNKQGISDCLTSLGNFYYLTDKYDLAIDYYMKSLNIDIGSKNIAGIAANYSCISSTYQSLNDYSNALKYSKQALELYSEIGDTSGIAVSYAYIAYCYQQMQDYQKSIEFNHKSLELSKQIKSNMAYVYNNLSAIYALINDYKNAYEFFRLYSIESDSLFNKENSRQINEMEIKYESERKEQQIKQQQLALEKEKAENDFHKLKIKRNRNLIIALTILFISFIVIILFIVQRYKYKTRERSLRLEHSLLRSQMNPHFIFNALNSIQSCILHEDKMVAYDYHAKFAKLMRMILINTAEKSIPIKTELETLKLYMDLEVFRTDNKFKYEFNITENIDTEKEHIPTMLIQPYLENAIWHGIMHKKGTDGIIKLNMQKNENMIICTIEDNGIGRENALKIKEKNGTDHKSISMSVTKQRLDLYNLENKNKLSIKITDLYDSEGNPTGTKVETFIPVLK